MPKSTGVAPLSVTTNASATMETASKAMRAEVDGGQLRKDLTRAFRDAADPFVNAAKSSIRSVSSTGQTVGPSIRSEIAKQIKPVIRTTGATAGVSIKVGDTQARGFRKAARSFNAPSFRHPVYGGKWVSQRGKPGWFDNTAKAHRAGFERATEAALKEMAERIASRARSGT